MKSRKFIFIIVLVIFSSCSTNKEIRTKSIIRFFDKEFQIVQEHEFTVHAIVDSLIKYPNDFWIISDIPKYFCDSLFISDITYYLNDKTKCANIKSGREGRIFSYKKTNVSIELKKLKDRINWMCVSDEIKESRLKKSD